MYPYPIDKINGRYYAGTLSEWDRHMVNYKIAQIDRYLHFRVESSTQVPVSTLAYASVPIPFFFVFFGLGVSQGFMTINALGMVSSLLCIPLIMLVGRWAVRRKKAMRVQLVAQLAKRDELPIEVVELAESFRNSHPDIKDDTLELLQNVSQYHEAPFLQIVTQYHRQADTVAVQRKEIEQASARFYSLCTNLYGTA